MAAGLGFKDFVTGEVLTAADVDGYLMQGIWVFDDAAARDAAVTSPQEGNACYLKDTNEVLTYSGSVWVAVGGGAPTSDYVNTTGSESTSSTSYTALTTATAVTMTTGTKALVIFSALVTPANAGYVSIAVSGSSTIAASDDNSAIFESSTAGTTVGRPILFTGLTAGSNTFSMQYRANTGTATFTRRNIVVLDMGS